MTRLITMYDSVTVSTVPHDARAVAGYVDGRYRSFDPLVHLFYPRAHCISITVLGGTAEVLDVEPGDVRPQHAAGWVKRMLALGHWRPCIYASLSTMPEVIANLNAAGLHRTQYRLWVADWTGVPHIPAGYDACQYTDRAMGRNLDASLCADSFWKTAPPAKKPVKPRKPHPKVIGSVSGAAVSAAILAVLSTAHVHVSKPGHDLVITVGVLIAGYFTPSRH